MMSEFSPYHQQGLAQINALMDEYSLTPGDVKKSYGEHKKTKKRVASGKEPLSKGETMQRLFVYLGGTLILSGLGFFISTFWTDMGSLPRVIITFGSGFVAYLLGILFAKDARYESMATPAFIVSFVLQPFGLFVLLKEYFGAGDPALGSMVVFGPLALQQGLSYLKLRRPALLLFTLLFFIGFSGSLVDYYDLNRGMSALIFGTFLLLTTIDMQMKSRVKELTPIFFVISTMIFFCGVYYYIGRTVFDPLALSLILSLLGFAVVKESKTLYVLALLYMAGYFIGGPGGGWIGELNWSSYNQITAIVTGVSLVLTGQWLRNSDYISLHPLWMFVGTGFALAGLYALFPAPYEAIAIGFAGAAVYAALVLRSRAVLAAAVLALLCFIAEFGHKYFADTVGWPLFLMAMGVVVLALGFVFKRLSDRIKTAA